MPTAHDSPAALDLSRLQQALQVGDLVFIRIGRLPFRQIADHTGSWTNHVGIVVPDRRGGLCVAESRVPWSGTTSLARFVARSEHGRMAVARLRRAPSPREQRRIGAAARRRCGVLYDTGFDLASRRQFCSRFVREVLQEATGQCVGEAQSLAQLLQCHPQASTRFWRCWYLGRIPWQRRTVTPASVLQSPLLTLVADGAVA